MKTIVITADYPDSSRSSWGNRTRFGGSNENYGR